MFAFLLGFKLNPKLPSTISLNSLSLSERADTIIRIGRGPYRDTVGSRDLMPLGMLQYPIDVGLTLN